MLHEIYSRETRTLTTIRGENEHQFEPRESIAEKKLSIDKKTKRIADRLTNNKFSRIMEVLISSFHKSQIKATE